MTRLERFRKKVVEQTNGCWTWTGTTVHGYGRFWNDGRKVYAHRWSYEHFVGPIPDGMEIDHLCRSRSCVNPDHMEIVTHRENLLRGDTFASRAAAKTHCVRGHGLTPENVVIRKDGGRRCRECCRQYDRERYRLRRGL